MSRPSTSLDLSEFFDDDDSEGHRLVEYIQKRRGGFKRRNCIFMNYEPQRVSLNVQLEKIPPSQDEFCSGTNKNQTKGSDKKQDEIQNNVPKDASSGSLASRSCEVLRETPLLSEPISHISESRTQNLLPTASSPRPLNEPLIYGKPASATTPDTAQNAQRQFLQPHASLNPLSPQRRSLLAASIRKCVSPNDKLRRYSLKRLSNLCGGRRTLLQEFESTIGDTNFDPPVCSTPLSQPQPVKPISALNSSHALESENVEPNTSAKSPAMKKSCCSHTDTLIKSLQRKDEELKKYMSNIIDNSIRNIQSPLDENVKTTMEKAKINSCLHCISSPLKSTYTVEKGNIPGQVILNLDKSNTESQSKLLNSQAQSSMNKLLKTQEGNLGSQNHSRNISDSPRVSKILESRSHKGPDESTPNPQTLDFEAPTTSQKRNVSIVLPMQEVEIAETENQTNLRSNSIIIQSDAELPFVVIPVNQTFNRTGKENQRSVLTIPIKNEEVKRNSSALAAPKLQQTAETSDNQCYQQEEDKLKLTDILTDDEDEALKSRSGENNTQAPLNLAQGSYNLRTKRLRKRSFSRRRLHMDCSQVHNSENETVPPPQAHSKRRMSKRKHIPLNRAPGTPLNGEQYAQELARMSNYEILDLRKRNSMGQVFAISGRRSSLYQKDVLKKKQQLDNQIEKEIERRNLCEITDKQKSQIEVTDTDDERNLDEHLPAPDDFRDSLPTKEKDRSCRDSSLIDERPSDRVSFKGNESKRLSKKRLLAKEIPEVLTHYLEVSNILSRKKNMKSNKSKRSLYTTQDHYGSDENNNSAENAVLEKRLSENRTRSIPYVPSPPKIDDFIVDVKVLSPPPPLSITLRKSTTQNKEKYTRSEVEDITTTDVIDLLTATLPPAPPGFESGSDISTYNNNDQSTTNSTLQAAEANANFNTNSNVNNDDHLFKIPDRPAPKNNVRKRKENKISSNNLLEYATNSPQTANYSTDSTGILRRSKRGHVPLKNGAPIFQILLQQTMNRRLEYYKRKEQREKEKERELSKLNKKNSGKTKVVSASRQKSTKVKMKIPNPTEMENDNRTTCLRQDVEALDANKRTKTKDPKIRKRNKKCEEMTPNENFESCHLNLNSSPVDHLNNVFDKLRNTGTTQNTPSQMTPSLLEVKSFKIRVARLKSMSQPTEYCDSVSTISSNLTKNSDYELISWLKNITDADSSMAYNAEIFRDMRISLASNISFTQLQGVEYAFYDTDDKASLGYLRFKPRQKKPKKRAKRFHLHFISLVGKFLITANDKKRLIGVGDMVAIEKSVYYDIENVSDETGILMVIKK